MRRSQWQQAEDANLQADVMRFMAIVAFCLIAILAMVRNITPTPDTKQTTELAQAQALTPDPMEPAAEEQEPEPAQEINEPLPVHLPARREDPQPAPAPVPALTPPEPLVATPKPEPASPTAPPATQEVPPTPTDAAPTESEGLILRFSSQGDFLRLVAKGKVDVYAFGEQIFLSMDSSYRFHESAPPKQVYELEPSGIPRPLQAALLDAHVAQPYTWAVGLPPRIERQIQGYLRQQATGQLLINRFEQVHHVEAP